jgi:hypothetical protein
MQELEDWLDLHESPKEIGGIVCYVRSHDVRTLIDQIRREQICRSEIIDALLATRGLSEGVTADAILAKMRGGE